MARVVVIRHEFEPPGFRRFTLSRFLDGLVERGHEVLMPRGLDDLPDADMAILHVDLSVVPEDYAAAAAKYPLVLNGKALDIRKRNVSRNILTRDTDWIGPVIVKTDLNCGGIPEFLANRQAKRRNASVNGVRPTKTVRLIEYEILPHPAKVAEWVWSDPTLIVERFLPERDARGYYTSSWIFLGDAERCARCRSAEPLVKGEGIVDVEYVDVPEFIRAERKRLGLDFGKLDFVIHDGEPVLLDANKTPGLPPGSRRGKRDISPYFNALEALLMREQVPV